MNNISELIGKRLIGVTNDTEEIRFFDSDGRIWRLYHEQDCCESVIVEDIAGDLNDLIGSPILEAEEVVSDTRPEGEAKPEWSEDSEMWTFYKLATIKGRVTIRWYGSSNGYYSERVSFAEAK